MSRPEVAVLVYCVRVLVKYAVRMVGCQLSTLEVIVCIVEHRDCLSRGEERDASM